MCLERKAFFTSGRNDGFEGQFQGPDCKKFLNNLDKLVEILKEEEGAFESVELILLSMRAFNKVREQCFGVNLDQNYKTSIREFAHFWLQCDRSITLKSHVLFVHVAQFLDLMNHMCISTKERKEVF